MQILLQYLKPYKWLVVLALFLAFINQSFSLLDPLIFGKIIDRFANHPHSFDKAGLEPRDGNEFLTGVAWLLLASMGVAMVSRIAKAFQDYAVSVVIQKFGARIFTTGLQHSLKLPFQDFEDQRSGETLSILTKVRTDTEKFITNFINIFFGIIVGVIFVAVYAVSIHWSVAPTYFAGILLLSWLTSLLSRKIKVIQKNIVSETTALAGSTTESLRNIELIKSLGLSEQEIKRLNNNTYKILGLELKKVKSIRTLSFIQGTFVNTLRQSILFLLMYLIFKNQLSVGQLFTMQLYSFFIFGPLQEIGNIILSYREAEASLNNFRNLMVRPAERKPAKPKEIGSLDTLSFHEVTFKHQTAQYNALDHISFTAKKGETIAFVGPSGSGKSTLVKLLVGLYIPQEGEIRYNDIEAHDILFDSLREQIGFVTQDTQLFAGTIRENLLFVRPDATDEELVDVLHKASCQYLLSRAENGVSTVIGEGGLKLSGGEKQRLSIARSLLRHPRLLIFDEATSALDSITEEEITGTIKNISAQREQITVLIAHRLSTIMHADRIYVLEKGQMAETGTHQSLLEEKGLYYAMWRQQIGERK
jgi:ATP-binding cassette subfamily B protein